MIDGRSRRNLIGFAAGALALLLPPPSRAAGTDGASFLDIPAGARPAALGGAYSALATDSYAPVWNPAGLGVTKKTEVSAMHLDYAEAIGYEFASLAHPLGERGGIGAAVSYLHPRNLVGRDAAGNESGSFSAHYAAYTLAYGHAFDALSVGAAAKAIETRLDDVRARAFGGDLGALYRVAPRVSVAVVAANLGTKLKFLNDGDRLAESYRVGVHVSPIEAVSLVAEGAAARDASAYGRFGAEFRPVPALALRAGYHTDATRNLSGTTGLTLGAGLSAMGARFDYAWAPMGDLGQTQYFSIVFAFGGRAGHE